jgi:membrane protein required for beta-lactamase induction
MLSISLVLALVLDRIIPSLQHYRKDLSVSVYFRWVEKNLLIKGLPARLIPLILLLPALLLVALSGVFFNGTFLALVFFTFIAFVCLEPRVLNEEVDTWLRELARDDSTETQSPDELFSRANRSLYTVIFWLVVAGPTLVVAYRLIEKLCLQKSLSAGQIWKKDVVIVLAWIEWLPAYLSSYLFLIGGNFDAGLKQARSMPLFDSDLEALNAARLQQVGKAALQNNESENSQTMIEFLRRCRGLLLRTLVLWLVLAALIDYWL